MSGSGLILERTINQSVVAIFEDKELIITVIRIGENRVKLLFNGPREIKVHRMEKGERNGSQSLCST